MSFLTRTLGMTPREAREVCQLNELIDYSLRDGPVPLNLYAQVWRLGTEDVDSRERSARRLVARLARLGYRVDASGDRATLVLDFSVDEALRVIVDRSIDLAHELRTSGDDFEDEDASVTDVSGRIPMEALEADRELGLTIRDLCRRYGITKDRVQAVLSALRIARQPEGRPPIERRRSVVVIEEALEFSREPSSSRKNGRVATVARILGCHRNTARAFIKRYDAIRQRETNMKKS